MLLSSGLATGLAVWLYQHNLNQASRDMLVHPSTVNMVRSAANTLKYGGVNALKKMLEEQKSRPDLHVYALDEAGHDVLGRAVSDEAKKYALKLAAKKIHPPVVREVYDVDKQQKYVLFIPILAGSSAQMKSHLPPGPPWFPMVMVVLGSFLFSTLLALYLSKPINFLKKGFLAFSKGKRISVAPLMGHRRDELADLGKEFDQMADHVASLMESQRNLLHDVSHELRSPLARLQARIGLLRQQPEDIDASLGAIEREAQRLDQLVGEVLTLSRLEISSDAFKLIYADEYIDVLELLDSIVNDARFEAESSSRTLLFTAGIKSELIIQGNGELLYRAIENVIRNAIYHTPENTTVEVSVFKSTPSQLHIRVVDKGEGVSEGLLEQIFEPFNSGKNSKGFGLGLAIARRAIEAHNGTITAKNNETKGLQIDIKLNV